MALVGTDDVLTISYTPAEQKTSSQSRGQIDQLINQYGRLIRSVVSRVGGAKLGGNEDEVEQRVIIALWKQIERERNIQHPSSYIYRAAVRETVRLLREVLDENSESMDTPAVATLKSAENPHRTLEAKEIRLVISACLKELDTERERAVRAHLAGFDVREIMVMYGWTYNKARNLIARGMADLRDRISMRVIRGPASEVRKNGIELTLTKVHRPDMENWLKQPL